MSLSHARAAIAHYYARTLSGVMVQQQGGPFTLEEIERWTMQTPALVVACLGVPTLDVEGGMSVGNSIWGAYCMNRNMPKADRSISALDMVGTILSGLPQQRWGNAASKMATKIGATNLYSSALDAKTLSLWVVRWEQAIDLPISPGNLQDFLRVGVTYQPSAPVDNTVVPAVDLVNLPASSLAPGTVGHSYSATLPLMTSTYNTTTQSYSTTPAFAWRITAGSLPAGLTLSSSAGTISGTPSAIGTAQFTVEETDNTGVVASAVTYLTIGPST